MSESDRHSSIHTSDYSEKSKKSHTMTEVIKPTDSRKPRILKAKVLLRVIQPPLSVSLPKTVSIGRKL